MNAKINALLFALLLILAPFVRSQAQNGTCNVEGHRE